MKCVSHAIGREARCAQNKNKTETQGRTRQGNYYASADASGGLPSNSKRRTAFHYRKTNLPMSTFSESKVLVIDLEIIFTHQVVEPHRWLHG